MTESMMNAQPIICADCGRAMYAGDAGDAPCEPDCDAELVEEEPS